MIIRYTVLLLGLLVLISCNKALDMKDLEAMYDSDASGTTDTDKLSDKDNGTTSDNDASDVSDETTADDQTDGTVTDDTMTDDPATDDTVTDEDVINDGNDSDNAVGTSGEMVLVPAGDFQMGCNEAVDSVCLENEKPYHAVNVPAYLIDKYEVTTENYAKCVIAGFCNNTNQSELQYIDHSADADCNLNATGKEKHPMNCVSWYGAKAYCEWIGGRLPTEAEWEKAARGTDGRKYPWGNNALSSDFAVYNTAGTAEVGSKEQGKSPYGLYDMVGNVEEIVFDEYYTYSGGGPVTNEKIARGGRYSSFEDVQLRASARNGYIGTDRRDVYFGFRCAMDAKKGSWSEAEPMAVKRHHHTATLLDDGKVLVAGGAQDITATKGSEVYDPQSGHWNTVGSLTEARFFHSAIKMDNGKVVVIAGMNGSQRISSAEIYDPSTESWSSAGSLSGERAAFAALLLPGDKIIIAGGAIGDPQPALTTVDILSPLTKSNEIKHPMKYARAYPAMLLLPDGKVMVVGGHDSNYNSRNTTEIYDPEEDTWVDGPSLKYAWNSPGTLYSGGVLKVSNNKYLILGGGGIPSVPNTKGQMLNTDTMEWTEISSLDKTEGSGSYLLLSNGDALSVGGSIYNGSTWNAQKAAYRYVPSINFWLEDAPMNTARGAHSVTLLQDGTVLVAGGSTVTTNSGFTNTVEIYTAPQ